MYHLTENICWIGNVHKASLFWNVTLLLRGSVISLMKHSNCTPDTEQDVKG